MNENEKLFLNKKSEFDKAIDTLPKTNAEVTGGIHKAILYIIRHGKTVYNELDITQGWSDSPLTEEGILQADAIGISLANIPFQLAYSSDLGRQKETARRILAKNKCDSVPKLMEDAKLREHNFGVFEEQANRIMMEPVFHRYGLMYGQFDKLVKILGATILTDSIVSLDETHTVETMKHARGRAVSAVKRIANATIKSGGGNVLIVTSGGIIGLLLPALSCDANLSSPVENGSVSTLEYDGKAFWPISLNDLSYLEIGKQKLKYPDWHGHSCYSWPKFA